MRSYYLLFLDCNDELQENTMANIADANEGNDELHENTMVADANTQPAYNTLMTNEGNCLFVYLPYWILHY